MLFLTTDSLRRGHQDLRVLEATLGWQRSTAALGAHVNAARAHGLVDGARDGFLAPLVGRLPNTDLWLREPDG